MTEDLAVTLDEDVKYKIFMFLKENELLDNVKHF